MDVDAITTDERSQLMKKVTSIVSRSDTFPRTVQKRNWVPAKDRKELARIPMHKSG